MVTRQRWRSLGHVFCAAGETASHASHASYPTPLALPDGRVRVFYSPRDTAGRSSIFSIDIALSPAGATQRAAPVGPWLEPGPLGAFDDAGASVAWVGVTEAGVTECWYLGWSLGVSVPFRTAIGCAEAAPGETTLRRRSFAPSLDRDALDPLSLGYPCLMMAGTARSIWYGTHRCPPQGGRAVDHVIRHASSQDEGRHWHRNPEPCLVHESPAEWALTRPSVLRDAEGWHMWYARRHEPYRLGYAHAPDGRSWTRRDGAIAFVTPEAAWEEGCRTYPAVLDHGGRRYMFYNGVGYGRSGFGVAVLED